MQIIERGTGQPIVLIPGIQGRWEYVAPAMDALASNAHVLTFPLCDEPDAAAPFDAARGMDNYAEQIAAAMDARDIARGVVCGVSFGGLAALRFAARWPARTAALILVSTPGPEWHLSRRHDLYARWPFVFGPAFVAESPLRLWQELVTAFPTHRDRVRFLTWQVRTLATAPVSLARMARRARLIGAGDRLADCAAVSAPTLVVHGDPRLDHVVDARGARQYAERIQGAQSVQLGGTGHIGSITRPQAFAEAVRCFLDTGTRGAHDTAA